MGFFIAQATRLGVINVGDRRAQLQKAAGVYSHNELMFFVCGYDYITAPSANKFSGMKELYLTANGGMSGYMNFASATATFAHLQRLLQGCDGASSSGMSTMHKALDLAADKLMTVNGLVGDLENSSRSPMGNQRFLGECSQLSQTHSAYWGNDLTRIGLLPQPQVKWSSKVNAKFNQWKQALNLRNAPTRARR